MLTATEIDLDQVDRDFDVAVKTQMDRESDVPWEKPATGTPFVAAAATPSEAANLHARDYGQGDGHSYATLTSMGALCVVIAGTAACVIGLATAVHAIIDMAWPVGHPDVRYDLIWTGAWLSAGAAGILTAVALRRAAAAAVPNHRHNDQRYGI